MIETKNLTPDELWQLYGDAHSRLLEIGEIRSRNITGDRGEQLAISYYSKIAGLPKLQMAPPSTQNIDAISTKGERYSVKTISLPNKSRVFSTDTDLQKCQSKKRCSSI